MTSLKTGQTSLKAIGSSSADISALQAQLVTVNSAVSGKLDSGDFSSDCFEVGADGEITIPASQPWPCIAVDKPATTRWPFFFAL